MQRAHDQRVREVIVELNSVDGPIVTAAPEVAGQLLQLLVDCRLDDSTRLRPPTGDPHHAAALAARNLLDTREAVRKDVGGAILA